TKKRIYIMEKFVTFHVMADLQQHGHIPSNFKCLDFLKPPTLEQSKKVYNLNLDARYADYKKLELKESIQNFFDECCSRASIAKKALESIKFLCK
ncbi:hypothetical protein HDU92_005501, partial [Lobulomyces angularis]